MYGRRCEECGEVRWSILGITRDEPDQECPSCGAMMVEERRYPGRRVARATVERRDLVVPRPSA